MVIKQMLMPKGLQSEVRDGRIISIINSFDDEVAG